MTPHEAAEKLARWMIRNSFATGHGDTLEDLLTELEWQVRERGVPFLRAALQEIEAKTLEYTYPGREAINAIARRALTPRGEGD